MSEEAIRNAIFTIIGGLIAGFSGIFVEWYRMNREARDKHFQDIKQKCLEHLKEELSGIRHFYDFREDGPHYSTYDVEKLLNRDIRWWENFSFKSRADAHLYEDLKNHYPDLFQNLNELEKSFRTEFSEFLREIYNLSKLIREDPDFKEFEKEYCSGVINETVVYPERAVFFLILDIDKSKWFNIYSYIKPELHKVMQIANKLRHNREAIRVKEMSENVLKEIDSCIEKLNMILLETKLKGKCKYLK